MKNQGVTGRLLKDVSRDLKEPWVGGRTFKWWNGKGSWDSGSVSR